MTRPRAFPTAATTLPLLLACLILPAPASAAIDLPLTTTTPAQAVSYREEAAAAAAGIDAGDFAGAVPHLEHLAGLFPDDSVTWESLGVCHYRLAQYPESARAYLRAVELGIPFSAVDLYNAACSQALAGDADAAVATLRRALAAGFEDRGHLAGDEDLVSLRDRPEWAELAGLLPADVQGRVAGWRYDLDLWLKEVRRLHPDPFAVVPEADFVARVEDLKRRVPDLTDEQVMMGLIRLATLLGDGHSGIRPLPASKVAVRSLPLQLYAFSDGLFVIDADSAYADLVGARVLDIGRRSVDDLWPRLGEIVPRDNPMRILQQGPFLLTVTAVLRDFGAIGDTEDVPLHVRDADGAERTVAVASRPVGRVNFELVPSRLPGAPEPPLYLAHADEVLWMGPVAGGHALYVEFNVVRDGPETIADFAKRLRGHLADHPDIDTVVLDVRHNGGGNSFLYPPLVRDLVWFQQERPDARLYVLMGRQTFSACQNFVTDLDTWTDAVFAGEPSGSRPNMIGESTFTVLPYSGLRAGISSRYHQTSYPGDDRRWIAPDLPVELTAADYFANRDPVLAAVLADLKARR